MQRSFFRKISSIVIAILFMPVMSSVYAEPVGNLPALSDSTEQILASQGKSVNSMKDEIPTKETVGLPIYPDSLYTALMTAEGMLPTVVLASEDSIEKVKEWYGQQDGLNWSEQWGMFYAGEKYVMMQSEAVMLMDISENPQQSAGGMAFDMTGMKTQISISYKPKTKK